VGLITLYLYMIHPSTHFHPNTLLQWLSSMPRLETLVIVSPFPVPNRDTERRLTHTPIVTPVALPNLHRFTFEGVSSYFEELVYRVTTPRLEKLEIDFPDKSNQLTFSVPRLVQFINAAEKLRFSSALLAFAREMVVVDMYPRGEPEMYALSISVSSWYLDWQVSSMAQISDSLSQMFSAVEHLTLGHEVHRQTSEDHNQVDSAEWCKLLRSFSNVKTLRIAKGLVGELSRCLQLEDGELPFGLLPELQELTYTGSSESGGEFTSFTDARQNAGRPVALVRLGPNPEPSPSVPPVGTSSTSPAAENDIDT
jgi:hypothetical protein